MRDDLAGRLVSNSMEERTRATYELDYADFDSPSVLAATRANLDATDPELVAITVMRLLVRGKDASSWQKVAAILRSSDDDYVSSSAILALANLARDIPDLLGPTIAELEAVTEDRISEDSHASLVSALAELRSTRRP